MTVPPGRLEAQALEDTAFIAHRHTPLGIVVLSQERIRSGPDGPGEAVITHNEVGGERPRAVHPAHGRRSLRTIGTRSQPPRGHSAR